MSHPFIGERFTFVQPDGTPLEVRGWGNQDRAVFETLDGYPVVLNPETGYYEYAAPGEEKGVLLPTGARPEEVSADEAGIPRGIDINVMDALARAPESELPKTPSRWQVRRGEAREVVRARSLEGGILAAPPSRQTVGTFVGLCILVQFPDVAGTFTREEVEAFCNQPGYTGFGNAGSVHDYFLENSLGRLRYTNVVTPYFTAKRPRSHYTDPGVTYGQRARELIREALEHFRKQGFDFSRVTTDAQGFVHAVNVFYAGPRVNNFQKGLWPHASNLVQAVGLVPGKKAFDYQISEMGDELALGTFCHESGHMVCDFPDLYDLKPDAAKRLSLGIGSYCLMCYGASSASSKKNPAHVCAYLKHQAGWAASVTRVTPGLAATARAGANEFFLHERSPTEYFIIENRHQAGRDATLPDSGLAIWHVDELGSNNNEEMTPTSHYECSLVQADNRFDLQRTTNNFGDSTDLFHAGGKDRFDGSTQPPSKWWDGTPSGLQIRDVSAPGPVVTFRADV